MGIRFSHGLGSGSFSYGQYNDFAIKLLKHAISNPNIEDLRPVLIAYNGYTIPLEQLPKSIREMKRRIPKWDDATDEAAFLKSIGLNLITGMEDALSKNESFTFI